MKGRYNTNGAYVDWAIRRMTSDYSVRDIQALLEREGVRLNSPEISYVLTRLKVRGQITEIKPGSGRPPAIFRGPQNATNADANLLEAASNTESTPGSSETLL